MTIEVLKQLRETEDKVEFKEARNNFPFSGGSHTDQEKRRKCLLGYVVAFANERGGMLVLGMTDTYPHQVVGSDFAQGKQGDMADEIFNRLHIRVRTDEFYEGDKRVLVIRIPSRPVGKLLKFEGVPLMRVGGSIRNMSDEEMLDILQEQEPDFSARICKGLTTSDLSEEAISRMREAYARKQQNLDFPQLPLDQVLTDLRLKTGNQLTYAALILLGKQDAIVRWLPQARVIWEFRYHDHQIQYDFRKELCDPLFLAIDDVWELINDKNAAVQVAKDVYIFPVLSFNEIVIREAILNAIAHRDYTITSEVTIHQYPRQITIINPGGFPRGVDKDNLVNSSSTPRSRLMAEIMEKTGLVERSGQGIDKIYSITLSEGKGMPDYGDSTIFQVTLKLNGSVEDPGFSNFINRIQVANDDAPRLGVHEIIALHMIKEGQFAGIKSDVLKRLETRQLVEKSTNTNRYSISEMYPISSSGNRIGNRYIIPELELLIHVLHGENPKIGDLETTLSLSFNRNQIKYLLSKLQEDNIVFTIGKGKGTRYSLKPPFDGYSAATLITSVITTLRELYPSETIPVKSFTSQSRQTKPSENTLFPFD